MSRNRRLAIAVATVLALLALPVLLSTYYVGLATKILIFALFAMSLDLLVGHAGLFSLGHAAFYGIAAYVAGIVALRGGDYSWVSFPAGVLAAGVAGGLFGLAALRARGSYFLMITLALAQVIWGLVIGWRSVTGGDDGLSNVPRPDLGLPWSLADGAPFYYFVLLITGAGACMLVQILRSPFGHALHGTRESESRMLALGYNVWLYRYVAFVVASLFAGVAGCLSVYFNHFVGPEAIHVTRSAEILLMVIAGGAGTLVGPAVGAAVLLLLENLISAYTERWLAVLGLVYVMVTLFAPAGIVGVVQRLATGEGGAVSALRIDGLSVDFGGLAALDAISLVVGAGERRLIIGPNGAGKTTLFNVISGLIAASAGTIALFGRDISRLTPYQRARLGVGRTFQITNLFRGLTVFENVLLAVQAAGGRGMGFLRRSAGHRELPAKADRLLDQWGLAAAARTPVRHLSYGEQRQLDLILALAQSPRLLLLDEPLSGLSGAESAQVVAMVGRLPRDITVLIIEHDMDVAFGMADRITVLHQGRLLAEGEPDAVRAHPGVSEIYLGAEESHADRR